MGYIPQSASAAEVRQLEANRRLLVNHLATLKDEILLVRHDIFNRSPAHQNLHLLIGTLEDGYSLSEAVAVVNDPTDLINVAGRRPWKDAWPRWSADTALFRLSPPQLLQLQRRMPTFNNPGFKARRMAHIVIEMIIKPVSGDALLCRLFPELGTVTQRQNGTRQWQTLITEHATTTDLLQRVRGCLNDYWFNRNIVVPLNLQADELLAAKSTVSN